MTPLEPFSKVHRREGISTPFPTAGNPCGLGSAFDVNGFAGVHPWDGIPDFGGENERVTDEAERCEVAKLTIHEPEDSFFAPTVSTVSTGEGGTA